MLLEVGAEDLPPEAVWSSFIKGMEEFKKKRAAEAGCTPTS
jgi:hypothetical protein